MTATLIFGSIIMIASLFTMSYHEYPNCMVFISVGVLCFAVHTLGNAIDIQNMKKRIEELERKQKEGGNDKNA